MQKPPAPDSGVRPLDLAVGDHGADAAVPHTQPLRGLADGHPLVRNLGSGPVDQAVGTGHVLPGRRDPAHRHEAFAAAVHGRGEGVSRSPCLMLDLVHTPHVLIKNDLQRECQAKK